MWTGYSVNIYGDTSYFDKIRDDLENFHMWHNYKFHENPSEGSANIAIVLTSANNKIKPPDVKAGVKIIIVFYGDDGDFKEAETEDEWKTYFVGNWDHKIFTRIVARANAISYKCRRIF